MSKQSILRDIETKGRVPKWQTCVKYEIKSDEVHQALEKYIEMRGIRIGQQWIPLNVIKLYVLADNLRHLDAPSAITIESYQNSS